MRGPGEILVVSCYELGRQPVVAAAALAGLERAGFAPGVQDVSVEKLSEEALRRARLVAVSVPMHTALQLGVRVAARARQANPSGHVAFFGLYATLNAQHLLEKHCDSVIGGESVEPLVALAQRLAGEPAAPQPSRRREVLPSRSALPLLDRYARLEFSGGTRLVASVEASRGCKHLCRHCPIVPVYRGRFLAVPRETVLADIEQQVAQGAEHVSFGDPDFLNGPTHALRIVRELHERWPALSFDATIKIEHLLQQRALLPELAACGLLFVTSAVESLNDGVLRALDKGHSAADVPVALRVLRTAGVEPRPTFLPYTPWTALSDLPALFGFIEEHQLDVDPVQLTLRLLIPPGSLVLEQAGPWLGELDPAAFGYRWTHEDPRVDALWKASSDAVRAGASLEELGALAGWRGGPKRPRRKAPRLTEPWFC
jgi:radical SAM superfamily enzyme YgiQ (UPF0313 family)